MKQDVMIISITEEAVIKVDTDRISQPNHMNAASFVNEIARLAGGSTTKTHKHKGAAHLHHHEHGEDHEHH